MSKQTTVLGELTSFLFYISECPLGSFIVNLYDVMWCDGVVRASVNYIQQGCCNFEAVDVDIWDLED